MTEDLTQDQVQTLQEGICCDCGGKLIRDYQKALTPNNVICLRCKHIFNLASIFGAERAIYLKPNPLTPGCADTGE